MRDPPETDEIAEDGSKKPQLFQLKENRRGEVGGPTSTARYGDPDKDPVGELSDGDVAGRPRGLRVVREPLVRPGVERDDRAPSEREGERDGRE